MKPPHEQTIIEPQRGWQLINVSELIAYRDLFYFLVWRDVKVLYKQTVLGFGWAIIRPIISMVIFSLIFGELAQIPSDGVPYPIFSYAALLPWTYFSGAMTGAAQSLAGNTALLTKIYFPRLVIPITPILAKLVDFLVAFLVLVTMMIWYDITPTRHALFLPVLMLITMLTAAGAGMWLTALGLQYRDVRHAISFLIKIMMYATPVVWPLSLLPEQYHMLVAVYPMVGVIEGFRAALLGTTPMPYDLIAIGAAAALLLFVSGMYYFRRMERIFADVA